MCLGLGCGWALRCGGQDAARASKESKIPKHRIAEFKRNAETSQLTGMRFTPFLKHILYVCRAQLTPSPLPSLS